MFYTTDQILSAAKLSSFVPIGQTTFQDSDLLTLLNEEFSLKMVSAILKQRENFFITSVNTTLTKNVGYYPIPPRAIGNALKKILYRYDGTLLERGLPMGQTDDYWRYSGNAYAEPQVFVMEGDQIGVLPVPTVTQNSLQVYYPERPSQLVMVASCGNISSVSSVSGTTTFTVDTDLTASLSVGSLVDFLSIKSPFRLTAKDVAITAITSTTIAVATSAVSDVNSVVLPAKLDYVCPAQMACIPMVPQEFHPILPQMVEARLLKALGHIDKMSATKQSIMEAFSEAFHLISNRVESESPRVNNRRGILAAASNPRPVSLSVKP